MNVRLVEVIGTQLWVMLKDEDHTQLTFKQIFSSNMKLKELPSNMTWEYLTTKYSLSILSMCMHNVYNTEDEKLHPGDMYWANIEETTYWDNHKGPHLVVILPNGIEWNIDSRANNCDMPNDRLHRCWVRTGEPPNVTAGKGGFSCTAGGGSILAGNYHGFLTNGVFKP